MSKALTIDQILAAEDVTVEAVDCPAWGGTVYVRTIDGNRRDAFDQGYASANGKPNLIGVRAKFVAACLCDEDGNYQNPSDSKITALGQKSSAMLDKVFEAAQRINGMRAEDVEALEKNSPPAATGDSG